MMNEFKVGDKVCSLILGKGIIESIRLENLYPVGVNFDPDANIGETYTNEGRRHSDDLNPEIYHLEEFKKRFESLLYEPLPALEEDAKVWIKSVRQKIWWTYHFSHFEGTTMFVFKNGRTSHTQAGTINAIEYSLTKPE